MARAIIHHPQSRANLLRETLRRDPVVRRAGIRLRDVTGSEKGLHVVVRKDGRAVRLRRGPEWRAQPLARLKASLRAQLMGGGGAVPTGGGRSAAVWSGGPRGRKEFAAWRPESGWVGRGAAVSARGAVGPPGVRPRAPPQAPPPPTAAASGSRGSGAP